MKKFLIILLIAVAVGGGYLLIREKSIYMHMPDQPVSPGAGRLVNNPKDLFNNFKDAVTNFVSQKSQEAEKTSERALDVATKKSESVIAKGKDSFVDNFRNVADTALTAALNKGREFLGIATGPGKSDANTNFGAVVTSEKGNVVSSLLGSVVKRGQPLTFVVSNDLFKNNNVSEVLYGISWGDGNQESKKIYAEVKSQFITHTFQKTGEYKPLFIFDAGGNKIQYEIVVVVEE